MSSLEDEGIPDPDEQPPGVDEDLAQEGIIAPRDAARAAGRHGETVAEQRAGTWPLARSLAPGPERSLIDEELASETPEERHALRREPGDAALGQLAGDDLEPDQLALVGDDAGIAPEERALSIVDEQQLADQERLAGEEEPDEAQLAGLDLLGASPQPATEREPAE